MKKQLTLDTDGVEKILADLSVLDNIDRKPYTKKKKRLTVNLPAAVIERARDCVYALQGPPTCLTLSALVREAICAKLEELKRRHNGGEDFPIRDGELRVGKPISG